MEYALNRDGETWSEGFRRLQLSDSKLAGCEAAD